MKHQKISIFDISFEDLKDTLLDLGQPDYRVKQLWRSLYHEGKNSFSEITNISKELRFILSKRFYIDLFKPKIYLSSKDLSTDKALFELNDGELIETVLMRYNSDGHRSSRKTVCLSTQAGCALGCTFCATGQQGFKRNLSVGEIVKQVLYMKKIALSEDLTEIKDGKRTIGEIQGVTNIVFMGMGEPLANYTNTLSAIRIINDSSGLNIGARHITISTVGLIPQILKLSKENIQINLAVSLHAPDDETRLKTMPINKRYPIEDLLNACKKYVLITGRRIFFEYVLLSDYNDSANQAITLGKLLMDINCHVNLIPVNPTDNSSYKRTSTFKAKIFQEELKKMNIPSTIRIEKGIDINAGCGQLRARIQL